MRTRTLQTSGLSRGGKVLNVVMSAILVVGLMPSLALTTNQQAYASDRIGLMETDPDAEQITEDMLEDGYYTIYAGGTYQVAEGLTANLVIETTDEVTIEGNGVEYDTDIAATTWATISSTPNCLHINCTEASANLTIKDLYNSVKVNTANVFEFTGIGNNLTLQGTNVLDYDYGYTSENDANIHVASDAQLTINLGDDSMSYMYNCTQGAGIGGVTGEMNGEIDFTGNGSLFIKGTRQGAVIGAGARANGTGEPGTISFNGSGSYNIITNSRGAAIGGAAGSNGGSTGTQVEIGENVTMSINTDYSGACIGGGGYAQGNDSSGGTLIYTGGSVRPYVDKNAASWVTTGWQGRALTEGVNDAVITAKRLNAENQSVYFATIPTNGDATTNHTIYVDNSDDPIYEGKLHQYSYVYDGVDRGAADGSRDASINVYPNSTIGNWSPDVDSNLYIFMTGENHTVTVDGTTYDAIFNESDGTFEIGTASDITSSVVASTAPAEGAAGTVDVASKGIADSTISVTATPSAGYYLAGLTYSYTDATSGETVTNRIDVANNGEYNGVGGTYSFTMPSAAVNVEATFLTTVWDGSLDFTWYDESTYVANAIGTYDMYYPAQWEALAWIASEDLYFLTEASISDKTAASAQDSSMTIAAYMASKGWTEAYQYNTNGNVPMVVGTIPTRTDLCVYSNSTDDSHYGNAGQNYFSGKTFKIMQDMDFGGTGTDTFAQTELTSLTSAKTSAAGLNDYYSYMGGHNYYPVGSQARNDGVYVAINQSAGATDHHFWGIFCGSVDGQGHLMDNVYCDRGDASNIGGATGGTNYYQSTGLIGRIGMPDSTDTTYASNDAVVENIAVDGFFYGERSVGGIVGKTLHVATGYTVTIENCMNFATVWSTQSKGSGGIVGAAWNSPYIINCVNFGRCINGYSNACGGITGSSEAYITNCYNVGMVSLNSGTPASFASRNGGPTSVTNCYALVGSTFSGSGSYSTATNPYLSYNLTGVTAISSLADAASSTFLASINGGGRDFVSLSDSATSTGSTYTLKSTALADTLTTTPLFYGYDGTTKSTQTGVANLPIPRAFIEDSSTVTSVALTSQPTTTTYVETQTFDTTGMVITASWSDGTTSQVTDYTVSNTDPLTTEDTSVTVSGTIGGIDYSYEIPITVTTNEVNSIAVTTSPKKTVYGSDEALDTTGMVVKAYYAAAPSTAVTLDAADYTVALNKETSTIDISYTYNGKTVATTKDVTILDTPAPSLVDGAYQLTCAADMIWFEAQVNGGQNTLNAKMMADIDMAGTSFVKIGTGTTNAYMGTFDGNGYKLNVALSNTSGYNIAPFGYVYNGAVIENLTVTGSVAGGTNAAGIVAYMYGGSVINCCNEATITTSSSSNAAGIVAYAYGNKSDVTISGCVNKGTVTKTTTTGSTSYGVGGVVGYAYAYSSYGVNIENCYNAAAVTAPYSVGGVVGYIKGYSTHKATVANCYNVGTVTDKATSNTGKYAGAVIGYGYNAYFSVSNCYYLTGTATNAKGTSTNSTASFTATAKTADELMAADMVTALNGESGTAWTTDTGATEVNSGYPILSWQYYVEPAVSLSAPAVSSGSKTTLTVEADGFTPTSYEFQKSADGVTWTTKATKTVGTYKVTAGNGIQWRVIATDGTNTATSAAFTPEVFAGTVSLSAPIAASGSKTTLTATADGFTPTEYTFQVCKDGETWTTKATKTTNTYNVTAGNGYQWRVIATDGTNTATSAAYTPEAATVVTLTSTAVAAGEKTTLIATATGITPTSYEFQKSADGVTWTTKATKTVGTYKVTAGNGIQWRVIVNDGTTDYRSAAYTPETL